MRRHYETKHQEKYSALNQQQQVGQIKQLQKNRSKQLDCFRKPTNTNKQTLSASYEVALIIAQAGKSYYDGEIVKKCMLEVVK